jgi:hypothetical protein
MIYRDLQQTVCRFYRKQGSLAKVFELVVGRKSEFTTGLVVTADFFTV